MADVTLYCADLRALGAPECCCSCHDDQELADIELLESVYGEQRAVVCCRVLDWLKENPPKV